VRRREGGEKTSNQSFVRLKKINARLKKSEGARVRARQKREREREREREKTITLTIMGGFSAAEGHPPPFMSSFMESFFQKR
jgi:hypothetical protein